MCIRNKTRIRKKNLCKRAISKRGRAQFLYRFQPSFNTRNFYYTNDTRGLSHESHYDTYLASRGNQYNAHVDTHVITLNTNSDHSHGQSRAETLYEKLTEPFSSEKMQAAFLRA